MPNITAFPTELTLTNADLRVSSGSDCEAIVEHGMGFGGADRIRVRPPRGNGGTAQGYAGIDQVNFPATKVLHIRRLQNISPIAAASVQTCKWTIAMRYPTADSVAEVGGCRRAIVMDHLVEGRKTFYPSQGVCSKALGIPNLVPFDMNAYAGQDVCVEDVFDLNLGLYSVYVTTQDGVFQNALVAQIRLSDGYPGNIDPERPPTFLAANAADLIEDVPSPDFFKSTDPTHWGASTEGGANPQPDGCYVYFSHYCYSDSFIGAPAGFGAVPIPDPVPVPVELLAPAPTGGRMHVVVDGVVLGGYHTQFKEAIQRAGKIKVNNPGSTVSISTEEIRIDLA